MDRTNVDAWIIICRENNNDPMARHVGCENAGGQAGFLFFRDDEGVRPFAISPAGEATALAELEQHEEVLIIGRENSLWNHISNLLERFNPAQIAINSGGSNVADGLSHTQYTALANGIGSRWMSRTVSSDELIADWLSTKTDAEIEIMRRAAELTAQFEVWAYESVIPGETTDRELADKLEALMEEYGVTDAWSPAQNPAINSGRDRGHSHPTDRVIRAGDFIQTDFGIRVHDMWVTDIQRFAYVLAPGESDPPAQAIAKWNAARAGSRAAFNAMRPGATGADVDRAQRVVMQANESLPVPWSTGHPVGYWAHDAGPSLGGGTPGQTARGRQLLELRPGMTFAFDGFHSWDLTDSTTKTISVEEMAVITETGAEWLTEPQEELILIRSR
jgi:Xaa-Pro aminopeptidase